MATREWVTRWKYEIAAKASEDGIWKLRKGGYLVRARVTDPKTGHRRDVMRTLPEAKLADAQRVRQDLLRAEVERLHGTKGSRQLFATYAVSLLKRKITAGELGPKTQERWTGTLTHFLIPAFGAFYMDEIRVAELATWRDEVAVWMKEGREIERKRKSGDVVKVRVFYKPSTVNGWLRTLRHIFARATAELELSKDPALAIAYFDPKAHRTYTRERPNALTRETAKAFVAKMRDLYPQHYALTLLGFMTGLRPSTLRPLRWKGPESDVTWREGRILVRRSNPVGQETVDRTKTSVDQELFLPPDVMAVLRWHVDGFQREKQKESDLLFPARHGGYISRSVLDKPFKDVGRAIGLPFKLTPRGMRRTFKDLCRLAGVTAVTSKAVSGHQTEEMHEHYQTVQGDEMRAELAKIAGLLGGGPT